MRGGDPGRAPARRVEAAAEAELRAAGFAPDYAVVRRPDLSEPADGEPGPRWRWSRRGLAAPA